MSKGSRPRPIKDVAKFNNNWDRIFGSKDQKSKHGESRPEEKEAQTRRR